MEIQKKEMIYDMFIDITEEYLSKGENINNLKAIAIPINNNNNNNNKIIKNKKSYIKCKVILLCLITIVLSTIIKHDFIGKIVYDTRCYIPNNYLLWEFSRPYSNCNFCRNINKPIILNNITRQDFKKYAYTSKPIIVKNGAKHWKASNVYNISFFKYIYDKNIGAYESIDEDCQFLNFKTNFTNLKQVFYMSDERAMNIDDKDSWYVGWKNCHPDILNDMNQYYEPPNFLPIDAEIPQANYIFMGYEEGASMHLDYIPRLMWQGQIIGRKTWAVAPTPECENVCEHFNFDVDTGDVVLLDTRVWYHGTFVKDKKFSLTITSEYG